jgi:hypothetical protein
MEAKMTINSKIENKFLNKIYEIVVALDFNKGYSTFSYD